MADSGGGQEGFSVNFAKQTNSSFKPQFSANKSTVFAHNGGGGGASQRGGFKGGLKRGGAEGSGSQGGPFAPKTAGAYKPAPFGLKPGKPFGNRSAVFSSSPKPTPSPSIQDDQQTYEEDSAADDIEIEHASTFIPSESSVPAEQVEPPANKENRFFEMRAQREALRAQYILQGILPDPEKPTDLAEAKALRGTCMEMCPAFEREEREFQNEGDVLEMYPGTQRIDPRLAVKIYRRPAAGRELPLPEDVRPPIMLRRTLDYLVHRLLPSDPGSSTFTAVQPFLWNRTRAIRQDFIVQGERGALAIECHERIARYHILCLHWRGGVNAEGWSEQQELEQLRKTIRSLTEFYEDMRRKKGQSSPNEAEFRAYNLLLHIHDPETLREVEILPEAISDAPIVQVALQLRTYAQRSNNVVRRGRPRNTEATTNLWTRFFGTLRQRNGHASYLLACLAENSFSPVRAGALKAMSKTYLSQHAPIPLDFLQRSLGLDSEEEARAFSVALGAEEAPDLKGVRLGKVNDEKVLPVSPFSHSIVEAKRRSFTVQDVIDGKASSAAPLIPDSQKGPQIEQHRIPKAQIPQKIPSSVTTSAPPVNVSAFQAHKPPTAPAQVTSSFASTPMSAKAPAFVPFTAPSQTDSTAKTTSAFSFKQSTQDVPAFSKPATTPSQSSDSMPAFKSAPTEKVSIPSFATLPPKPQEVQPARPPPSLSQNLFPSPPKQVAVPQVLPPKSPAQVVSKPVTPAPPVKRRTVSSVAKGLYIRLAQDVITRKVQSIAEQTCLREERMRRTQTREAFITSCVEYLCTQVIDEALDEKVGSCSSETIAMEWQARSDKRKAWKRWSRAFAMARDRAYQASRLQLIRSRLGSRPLKQRQVASSSSKATRTRETSNAVEDGALRQNLQDARKGRSDFWLPSTFLYATAAFAESILIPGIESWTVGLVVAKPSSASSEWLRVKFSLDKEPHAEVVLRPDACVHAMDLAASRKEDIDDERDLGLLVFELDADLDVSASPLWVKERRRLEAIADRDIVKQSRFLPKLLFVAWFSQGDGDDNVNAVHRVDTIRKAVVTNLGLRSTDPLRHLFSQIVVWPAGQLDHSPQSSFNHRLELALQAAIEWNSKRLPISFEDIFNACSQQWRITVDRLAGCTARLNVEGATVDFTVLAFNTATVLCRRVIDDIVTLSEMVHDENRQDGLSEIPLVSVNELPAGNRSIAELLYKIAHAQMQAVLSGLSLDRLGDGVDGSSVLLLRTWLIEHEAQSTDAFPWNEYFGGLLQLYVAPVQQLWIESTLPSMQEIEAQLEPSNELHRRSTLELEWKARALLRSQSTKRESAKRGSDDDALLMPVKVRRIEPRVVEPKKETKPFVYVSPAVSSLQSLVASANALLEEKSHLRD